MKMLGKLIICLNMLVQLLISCLVNCVSCITILNKMPLVVIKWFTQLTQHDTNTICIYSGTCLIRHTKGPGKCVRLYRMLEYSGFILVNRNTLGP